nr:basic proline-rich protein-like [Aegilops tauschii subsp. strangulata]
MAIRVLYTHQITFRPCPNNGAGLLLLLPAACLLLQPLKPASAEADRAGASAVRAPAPLLCARARDPHPGAAAARGSPSPHRLRPPPQRYSVRSIPTLLHRRRQAPPRAGARWLVALTSPSWPCARLPVLLRACPRRTATAVRPCTGWLQAPAGRWVLRASRLRALADSPPPRRSAAGSVRLARPPPAPALAVCAAPPGCCCRLPRAGWVAATESASPGGPPPCRLLLRPSPAAPGARLRPSSAPPRPWPPAPVPLHRLRCPDASPRRLGHARPPPSDLTAVSPAAPAAAPCRLTQHRRLLRRPASPRPPAPAAGLPSAGFTHALWLTRRVTPQLAVREERRRRLERVSGLWKRKKKTKKEQKVEERPG